MAKERVMVGYRRAGRSGLLLPEISFGLWQNFGEGGDDRVAEEIVATAFDHGITYFDLADNYGPPEWSAEERFGRMLRTTLSSHRDEIVIATKAGHLCWNGPYGDWGSKKHLIASLDRSLQCMGLDYVDIFYHHRPDPDTPMEETAEALAQIVRSGKALYVAISKYSLAETVRMVDLLERQGIHPLVNQVRYNIMDRHIEGDGLLHGLAGLGMGSVIFSPLNQGILTDKYLSGTIPGDSRGVRSERIQNDLTDDNLERLRSLNELAARRGQSLAEMAITWLLARENVTSVLVGARTVDQLLENIGALATARDFSSEELDVIDRLFRP